MCVCVSIYIYVCVCVCVCVCIYIYIYIHTHTVFVLKDKYYLKHLQVVFKANRLIEITANHNFMFQHGHREQLYTCYDVALLKVVINSLTYHLASVSEM